MICPDEEIHTELEKCEVVECQPEDFFGPWNCFTEWSKTCVSNENDPRIRIRTRLCKHPDKSKCVGQLEDIEESFEPKCTEQGKG